METFFEKHAGTLQGVLSGFDRMAVSNLKRNRNVGHRRRKLHVEF